MKKKVLVAIVVAVMVFAMTGCGREDEKQICYLCNEEKVCEQRTMLDEEVYVCQDCVLDLEDMFGVSDDTNAEDEPNIGDVGLFSSNFSPNEEILNADFGSGMIQIGDELVYLPMRVQDLTEKTNAEYYSIDYNPDISSNEFMLSSSDGAVIAGLYFADAECEAVYYSRVPETSGCEAGDLIAKELRDITSPNIILPKGITVGMTLDEVEEILGESMSEGYSTEENQLSYEYEFSIEEKNAIENCNLYHEKTYPEDDVPENYYGVLEVNVDRETGEIVEIRITYGYERKQ